jgi:SLOG cluster4 family
MKPSSKSKLPRSPAAAVWEHAWQKHRSKVGLPGYELPVGGRDGDERDFLTHVRTPEKETARLKRINDEFIRGFNGLFHVGPTVTVFGSARFKETHPYYKLASAVGAELAKTGFATLTSGGPGIMEAANPRRAEFKPETERTRSIKP